MIRRNECRRLYLLGLVQAFGFGEVINVIDSSKIEVLFDDRLRYGTCPRCEEDIALKRLEAAPDVIFCFDCATALEKQN